MICCPRCQIKLVAVDTRVTNNQAYRKKRCPQCKKEYTTKESIVNSVGKEELQTKKCAAPDCQKVFLPSSNKVRFCSTSCGSRKNFFGRRFCKCCKTEKPEKEFYIYASSSSSRCKRCESVKRKERAEKARVSKPAEDRKKPKLGKWPTNMDFSK